jgi:hypothetical protein
VPKITEKDPLVFSCDFLKFKAKNVLITNLLFEKCQTTELILFLDSYQHRIPEIMQLGFQTTPTPKCTFNPTIIKYSKIA